MNRTIPAVHRGLDGAVAIGEPSEARASISDMADDYAVTDGGVVIPPAWRSVIMATTALSAYAPLFVHATCASTIGRTSPPITVKVVALDRSIAFDSPTEREITARLLGWLPARGSAGRLRSPAR